MEEKENMEEEQSTEEKEEEKVDWEAKYNDVVSEMQQLKAEMGERDKREYREKSFGEKNVKPSMKEMLNRLWDTFGDDEEGFWKSIMNAPELFNQPKEFNNSFKTPEEKLESKEEEEKKIKSGGIY